MNNTALKVLDLFSGIGGFSLGLERAGMQTVAFCEIDKFCQKILKKHWPEIPIFDDIKELTWEKYVQTVSKQKLAKINHIANHVTQKECENGEKKIEKSIGAQQESGAKRRKKKSFNTTAGNVSAAEKIQSNFSQLIINTTLATQKGQDINHKHGNSLLKEGFRSTIKSSTITAITQKQTTGPVRINQEYQIDVITAGVPCQPASVAGRRRGKDDDRWLWPEAIRVVRDFKPLWVIFENVRGFVSLDKGVALDQVLSDLESDGYEIQTFIIPACAVNAPHRRDRVWIIANNEVRINGTYNTESKKRQKQKFGKSDSRKIIPHANGERQQKFNIPTKPKNKGYVAGGNYEDVSHTLIKHDDNTGHGASKVFRERSEEAAILDNQKEWLTESPICGPDDGISDRLARLKALGNAVVPALVQIIGECILEVEK